jgi:undecaprenyl phosphate-alpha-L-ara4N flippase subunit ArnE
MTLLLIFTSVVLGAVGQVLLKMGALRVGGVADVGLLLWRILTNPHILAGFALYGVASVLWIVVLSRAPLSLAYPLLSLGYVLVLLASAYVFGETIPAVRVAGIAAILVGILLVSSSA